MPSLVRSASETPPSAGGAPQHRSSLTPLGSPIELAHPTPDLQSLQGAYVQNVERLEQRAERMSCSSSDLGEEIRKLQLEQKASDSRRASLIYQASGEPVLPAFVQRPRNVSTSSYANSIVEVNGAARFGGYSPYSPIGSLRSGSWSQVSHPLSSGPARTTSRRSSKFGMMPTPEASCESPREERAGDASPSVQHTPRPSSRSRSRSKNGSDAQGSLTDDEDTRARRMKRLSTGRLPSDGSFSILYNQLAEANVRQSLEMADRRVVSDTSFTDIYDQIAGEIKDTLDTSVIGAQERELERQSNAGLPAQLLPAFNDMHREASSKPQRLSEPPPPLPPQHKELPQKEMEAQEDYGINFSFTQPGEELPTQEREGDPALRPLQIHVPHDGFDDEHQDRPLTGNSQDTFQQAQGLFHDFDGTHYAPSMFSRYNSVREPSSHDSFPVEDPNRSSMLRALPEASVTSLVPPPPEDGMVYYPAPVPRMLNLPQKISQAPSSATMVNRKTQVINALPEDARRSAYWLPQAPGQPAHPGANADARQSRLNLAALPPQLRASVFFDPGSQQRDVEVKDGSAVRTLDNLLDASAMAPVSAFTDHPIVGKSGGKVYKKSNEAQASTLSLAPPGAKERKGSFLGFGRRSSVGSENALDHRRSASPNRLAGAQLDDSALARGPDGGFADGHSGGSTPALDPNGVYGDLRDHDISDNESGVLVDEEEDASGEESDAEFGAPTTLLAEIELRKREQKNRTRTAYTAFPGGMHATLLELDDVAQLQKAKRKKTRVALAWEDPALKAREEQEAEDDDDVPLGVIYANNKKIQQRIDKQRLAEGRPLGLIEKKELEDNEPLSRRMLRLKGINPNTVTRGPPVAITNPQGAAESESEHEGETLKQRMQRLREKKTLDETISGIEARPMSEAFTVDVLSQFGGELGQREKDAKKTDGLHSRNVSTGGLSVGSAPKSPGGGLLPPSKSHVVLAGTPVDDEDETLGQRRARLQRQAMQQRRQSSMTLNALNTNPQMSAMNLANPNMIPTPARTPPPTLRASVSLADLLAANPVGKHEPRKVSNDMLLATAPPTSLLAKDANEKNARKARMRLSSAEMLAPSHLRPDLARQASAGSAQGLYGLMAVNNGGGNGMYVNQQQMYGMWAQQQGSQGASMMQLHQQGYGYPLTPHQYPAQSAYGYAGMQPGQPSPYGAMSANPLSVYGAQLQSGGGGYQQSMYGGGHMQQEGLIDHKTRSRVDAWRQGIMPS